MLRFLDVSSDAQTVILWCVHLCNPLDSAGAVCHVTSAVGEQLPAAEMQGGQSEMSETELQNAISYISTSKKLKPIPISV